MLLLDLLLLLAEVLLLLLLLLTARCGLGFWWRTERLGLVVTADELDGVTVEDEGGLSKGVCILCCASLLWVGVLQQR